MEAGENMSKQVEPGKTFSLEYAFPHLPFKSGLQISFV
jgi:hypothetical protein